DVQEDEREQADARRLDEETKCRKGHGESEKSSREQAFYRTFRRAPTRRSVRPGPRDSQRRAPGCPEEVQRTGTSAKEFDPRRRIPSVGDDPSAGRRRTSTPRGACARLNVA